MDIGDSFSRIESIEFNISAGEALGEGIVAGVEFVGHLEFCRDAAS